MDCKSTMHRFESDRRLHHYLRLVRMRRIPLFLRIVLLVAAAMMMVSGYVWGDPMAIWQEAASICLACIGVG